MICGMFFMASGLSIAEAAEMHGVEMRVVGRWVAGHVDPPPSAMDTISGLVSR